MILKVGLKNVSAGAKRNGQSRVVKSPQAKEVARTSDDRQVRRRDAHATRARILEAAMGEFAAKGLDARIEDIAEMAGANRRMAYWYFGSKEGLYLAALEATYLELVEVERKIDVDALGPLEAIAALVSAKFEHYVRYPRYVEFLKIENLYQARHLKSSTRIRELRGPLVALLKRVLERGQTLGVLRRDVDPVELYIAICAIGFFAFSNRYTLGVIFDEDVTRPEALDRRRRLIVDMVTAYLTTGSDDAGRDRTDAPAKAGRSTAATPRSDGRRSRRGLQAP